MLTGGLCHLTSFKHNHHLLLSQVYIRTGTLAGVTTISIEIICTFPSTLSPRGMLIFSGSSPETKLNVIWRGEILLLRDTRRVNGLEGRSISGISTSLIYSILLRLLWLLGKEL